jgi:hypothetical protein
MNHRLLRVVSGTLVLIGAAAPSSATLTANAPNVLVPLRLRATARQPLSRAVRIAGSQQITTVLGPASCPSNGVLSFVGEVGYSAIGGFGNNYAGGGGSNYPYGGWAGVLAGSANEACSSMSAVVAGGLNTVGNVPNGAYGSYQSVIAGGENNNIGDSGYGFIGGGQYNLLGATPPYNTAGNSAIVSGVLNTIGSPQSFIGSGQSNTVIAASSNENLNGQMAFIGAGQFNNVAGYSAGVVSGQYNSAVGDNSAVGGGYKNIITGEYGVIGGGLLNSVTGEYANVSGGYNNIASGIQAAVAGGYGNVASGRNAIIPGGAYNLASGLDSFAAGNTSHATYDGTFVWSDFSVTSGVTSTGPNQFLARAAGGFYLYSSASLKSGVRLAPGSGSWSTLSDRAAKTGIVDVDNARILATVVSLPVSEWSYAEQGSGIRHLGPMAQDFHALFGLGEDDKHISAVDEEGVALAAIKALQAEVSEKDRALTEMRRKDEANANTKYMRLEQRLDALEARLKIGKDVQGG